VSMRRILALVGVVLSAVLVPATTATGATPVHRGWATYYDQSWSPRNNCGTSAALLGTGNYAALNFYASPKGGVGAYANGSNCGRYIRVTIGRKCVGVANAGNLNQGFCRGGRLVDDRYTGAALTFVVADSCPDANAWCRQDAAHLDLAHPALDRFVKAGRVLTGLGDGGNWNNRRISWTYVAAPGYRGDVHIAFTKDAQRYWPAVVITHLQHGIGSVRYLQSGTWHRAAPVGSLGQELVLGATVPNGTHYAVKIVDRTGRAIHGAKAYRFTLPRACANACSADHTPVAYRVG